ncbi:MAG: hypothetical protein ACPL6C_04830 [bacterium]
MKFRIHGERLGNLGLLFSLFLLSLSFASETKIPKEINPKAFARDFFGNFYILDRTNLAIFKLDSSYNILKEASLRDISSFIDPVAISFLGLKLALLNIAKNELIFMDKDLSYLSSLKIPDKISIIDFDATSQRIFVLDSQGRYISVYLGKEMKRFTIRIDYDPTLAKIRAKEKEKSIFLVSGNEMFEFELGGRMKKKLHIDGLSPKFDISEKIISAFSGDTLRIFNRSGKIVDTIKLDDYPIDIIVDNLDIYLLFRASIRVFHYDEKD